MLFTRCPDCDTTFRVTDDALKKANGQVRCGRCASVFNAYAERREEPVEAAGASPSPQAIASAPSPQATASEPSPQAIASAPSKQALAAVPSRQAVSAPGSAPSLPPAASQQPLLAAPSQPSHAETPATPPKAPQEPLGNTPPVSAPSPEPASAEVGAPADLAAPSPTIHPVAPTAPEEPRPPELEPDEDPLATLSVEAVVAQLELGAADANAADELADLDAAQNEAMPPAQVEAVLETEPIGDWRHALSEFPLRRSGLWSAGVALGVVALALQLVNHYRAELVKQPSVGSLVQSAYAALGIVVLPRWDVRQYQILDWVATAEPSSGGMGSLRITAHIMNAGPEYQPYPDVNLRLKDRWEAAVGGRVFAPAEYLAAAPRKLMAPGETARAQLELVDPGPDAYGFDLDVCVEVETHVLSCRNDKVFL
jgi:predicted Zn finger-like uncharacterized protein